MPVKDDADIQVPAAPPADAPAKTSKSRERNKEGQQPEYSKEEKDHITFLDNRLEQELFVSRREVGLNRINIENIWDQADTAYEPHRLGTPRPKHFVQDELQGLRGVSTRVRLGEEDDWQSDRSKPNPYIKIQTALSILVEGNPEGVFQPGLRKYEQTTLLAKSLHKQSWQEAHSKQQLKVGIFNLAKYGFMCMRTFPYRVARPVQDLKTYNAENPLKSEYTTRENVEYDGIWRESLPPRHVWIDDLARPGDYLNVRDWAFYKKYSLEQFRREFGAYPYASYVMPTSVREEEGNTTNQSEKRKVLQDANTVNMYFYENKELDWYGVRANDVWVIPRLPLPTLHKQLSGWWTHWTLRDDATIFGIGIFEAIRHDHSLLDQIRNMTIDQLVLLIYKFFLYSGTNQADSTGVIRITPGVGKQVTDVNNIKWVDVPGIGAEVFKMIEKIEEDIEDASAVSKPVQGRELGKTAFELKVVRDASLQRLKTPLENIADALTQEAYLTVKLNEQILSLPEVIRLQDPENIKAYMDEVRGNEELYEAYTDSDGNFVFNARLPKEVHLSLETDPKGNLVEGEEERFFRIIPSKLRWEGLIRIDPQSVLAPSKELDKQMKLELFNLVMPLIQPTIPMAADELQLYLAKMLKPVKNILRVYEEDVNDWLPDDWLNPPELSAGAQPLAPEGAEPLLTPEGGAPEEGGAASSLFVPSGAVGAAQPQPLAESPRLAGRQVQPAGRPNLIQRVGNAFNALRGQ